MKSKIIKTILAMAAVACLSFAFVQTTDTKQIEEAKAPEVYMRVDPGGAGG